MRFLKDQLVTWRQKMFILQRLAELTSSNPRETIVITKAMTNPLLRMVTIDDDQYIAHVALTGNHPHIAITGYQGNPLENQEESVGKHRIKMALGVPLLVIERNMGSRHKNRLEQELEEAAERIGRASMGPLGVNWGLASQHTHLIHAIACRYGDAFEWRQTEVRELSTIKRVTLLQRKKDLWHNMPTFDLILST